MNVMLLSLIPREPGESEAGGVSRGLRILLKGNGILRRNKSLTIY
jgi:hypothetical protein